MNIYPRIATLLLATATLTLTACDDAPASARSVDALSVEELDAIHEAVEAAASDHHDADADADGDDDALPLADEDPSATQDAPGVDALGPMSFAAPIDPALGCGWEYPVCISWCLANHFSHECFSACVDLFCD